ncbi:hypothetical protein LA080_011656 [Diaporthe eres]|nr:hypothetical protein LA080_011656 [Diaporthe eres]
MPLALLLPDAAAGVTRALEQVLRRRPGAEDGPEHACKFGIPPPSRRFSSMADSWRRGASNVHDPGLDLNPKLNVDLRLDPNMCIQDGSGDLLLLVVRAREIGRAHRMWLSCHAHDDRLRPVSEHASQGRPSPVETWALAVCCTQSPYQQMQTCVAKDVAIGLGARMWTSGGQFHGLLIHQRSYVLASSSRLAFWIGSYSHDACSDPRDACAGRSRWKQTAWRSEIRNGNSQKQQQQP